MKLCLMLWNIQAVMKIREKFSPQKGDILHACKDSKCTVLSDSDNQCFIHHCIMLYAENCKQASNIIRTINCFTYSKPSMVNVTYVLIGEKVTQSITDSHLEIITV